MKRARIVVGAILLLASSAWAQPYGMGPGMMGGYGAEGYGMGPGMMGGRGGGYGMGPGMMGGYGGGYGMGPGMMGGYGGGYGMGPGMMGGYGPGGYGYGIPDLTSAQRAKMAEIQDEFGRKQAVLMESMHGLARNRSGAYRNGKYDEKAAREAFDSMTAIRKQMFENSLEAGKRMDAVLTAKQREEMSRSWGCG